MAGLFQRLFGGSGLLSDPQDPSNGLLGDAQPGMAVAAPNILDLALSEARKRSPSPGTMESPFNFLQNMLPVAVSTPGAASPDPTGLEALKPYLRALQPDAADKRAALWSAISDAGAGISNAKGTYGGLGPALSQGLAAGNAGYDRSLKAAGDKKTDGMETALKLRKFTSPELSEYGLNPQTGINPATGKPEFFVTDKYGRPKFLGVGAAPKAPVTWTVPSGRKELTYTMGPNGEPQLIGSKNLDAPPAPAAQVVQGGNGEYIVVDPRNPNKPGAPVLGPDGKPLVKPAAQGNAPEGFNKASTGLIELQRSLQNYRDTLARIGSNRVLPGSKDATDLQSAYTALQMGVKNAMELGALSGPDEQILNKFMTPPVSANGMLIGPDGLNAQLNQADAYLKNRRSAVEQTYGRTVGGSQAVSERQAAYEDYKQARKQAYEAGNYGLVNKMDAEARKDGLIR